jgi:signal transduction histidine kinase
MGELATLRADFSDMIAHELDAPLSAIRQLARMIGLEGLDPGVRASSLTIMDKEIDALVTLVEDVRAAAATERDDFEVALHPVPITALLTSAAAYADTLTGDHRLEVVAEDSLTSERVMADPERIGQVLRNLLSNAAKYSPEGTLIELRAYRSRRGGRIAVEVADQGHGVHPDDLAMIFEKFGRGRDRKGKSSGAGLYISRRIVQSHGSSMTVTSRPGEGAVFRFELEAAR